MKPVTFRGWMLVDRDTEKLLPHDDGGWQFDRVRPVPAFKFLRAQRVEVTVTPIESKPKRRRR